MSVLLETTLGDIVIDLLTEKRKRTCLNFLKLCKIKYYNYSLFHSVQRNFMAQTGDPTGTGRGGESIFGKLYGEQAKFFDPETNPKIKHSAVGTVSMVNNGNNMCGSQFFITLEENLDYLDGVHVVFGQVVEGLDILMEINEAICDEQHRPYKDIRINHTVILDDPFDDPEGIEVPPSSPLPSKEVIDSDRIAAHESVDDTEGKAIEEIEEEIQEKEAKARATILEMVGDLPEVDVKPPDNVLFVCKLNPVTNDDDLEIIFSRFGSIKSCEVIRDKKTGESLQYAFIEFEKAEDCENAYFKMNNVLIDDRRIHVDFSQSVSKIKWQGKGSNNNNKNDRKNHRSPEPQPYKSQYSKNDTYKSKTSRYEANRSQSTRYEPYKSQSRHESYKSLSSRHESYKSLSSRHESYKSQSSYKSSRHSNHESRHSSRHSPHRESSHKSSRQRR